MNVLLVAIDTLRADHLPCYGHTRKTHPTLAKLARKGVVFTNHFAPSIPTDPSYMSVFTSMDCFGHQVTNVGCPHQMSPDIKQIQQVLQKQGYFTAAVTSLPGHGVHFARGWDRIKGYEDWKEDRRKREKRNAERVNESTFHLLPDLPRDRPFFLFVHYWDPHTPYWPPASYRRLFYDKPEGAERDPTNQSMCAVYAFDGFRGAYRSWFGDVTDTEYVNAQYDAEIRYNSDHLAKLFTKLKRMKRWDDTLVIVFSDHGEILDEKPGQYDHHGLYEGNIHVPLVMRLPGDEHKGATVDAMTANVDVAPTILDVLGRRAPKQFEGKSLMPLARGERDEQYAELYLTEATWQCKHGVRTREWKFIRALSTLARHNWHGEGRRELYHLPSDPLEQTNVVHVRPRVAKELERRLDAWLGAQRKKYGHDDPVKLRGTSLGKKALARVRKADLGSTEPIR